LKRVPQVLVLFLALAISLPFLARTVLVEGPIRFESRRSSGIGFVLDNSTMAEKPMIDSVLGGVAVLDFDRDGFPDVFFTNGARIPSLEKDDPRFYNRLYRNRTSIRIRSPPAYTATFRSWTR
jgi:hypothetical protein